LVQLWELTKISFSFHFGQQEGIPLAKLKQAILTLLRTYLTLDVKRNKGGG
jgi:hypothetical protein